MKKGFAIAGIALLVLIGGGAAVANSEWQLNESWTLVRTGSLTVHGEADAKVFIDQKRVGTIGEDGTYTRHRVLPGNRNVLVSLDGAWPWTKNVIVESGRVSEAFPFLIPSAPNAKVLKESDEQYRAALAALDASNLPTPDAPLQSTDGTAEIYVRDTIIGSVWRGSEDTMPAYYCSDTECGPITVLSTPEGAVRGVAFFGDRNDVIIVAIKNGIWALDIEPGRTSPADASTTHNQTQNFQPLYLGVEPVFAMKDAHTIYIRDGAFVIELKH